MDFSWSEEQTQLRDELVRFAQRELNDGLAERDADHAFSEDGWKRAAAFGIQGLAVPEAYGGGGADPLTIAVALEALGYGCRDNGLIFSINAHMWSCALPIVKFGTEEQKRRYLPGLSDGSLIGVQAMTEPESGSDAFALATRATPNGDTYVVTGTKTFITNAPVADVFVVFATTDPSRGIGGLVALVVERGTPGLTVGRPFRKMGLHTSPMAEVVLDGCQVPVTHRLGSVGAGMAIFNTSMDWERSFILAGAVGTAERQLEESVAYAKQRRQFGQPIGKFQAVAHRLVDMRVRLEAARLLLYRMAWLKQQGRSTAVESAIAKLYISEMFVESSLDALQTHGGYGYLEEAGFERDVRDSLAGRIYSGTSDIQRNNIARRMGL